MWNQIELIHQQLLRLDPTPLLLAVLLGGLIGLEREVHGRPAGLRTHILVCLASTALILVSRIIIDEIPAELAAARLVLDPTRLAAGIVTGIGFLGAASVIRSGDIVRGITTGACIWSVSALGVVIGYEMYGLAVAITVTILCVLVGLDRAESWISPVIYRRLIVRGRTESVGPLSVTLQAFLKKHRVRVQDLTGHVDSNGEPFELVFHIRCRNSLQAPSLLHELVKEDGVESAHWRTG